MPLQHVPELAALIAGTDIRLLELRGPWGHLRLVNTPGGAVIVEDEAPAASRISPAGTGTLVLAAPSPGVFLRNHPLRRDPLVQSGTRVETGQIVALLQIGLLLRPVITPKAGVIAGAFAQHGTIVGYDTPLLELHAEADGG